MPLPIARPALKPRSATAGVAGGKGPFKMRSLP